MLSVIKIKSAPHRWSVPAAHASGEWLFGCIEPRWIAIDNSMYGIPPTVAGFGQAAVGQVYR
jgi:hypothetical protein